LANFGLTGVPNYVAPRPLEGSRDKGIHDYPFYLAWKAREAGQPTRFIELAGEINTQMPQYVVDKLAQALNEQGKAVKGAKVLVLGLAYKPNIDDPRESPAFEIIHLLLERGAEVSYHDPHIPVAPRMRSWPALPPMESVPIGEGSLAGLDAAIVVTDHQHVNYELVANRVPVVLDTRNALRGSKVWKA
jgi:UDP-N-acetyl-D-glucosamine dehydrogenase